MKYGAIIRKIYSMTSLEVYYWYVKMPRCGCVWYGLEYFSFYDSWRPLGAPAFLKLAYWSNASLYVLIADIQKHNNELLICWLCYNDTIKHYGRHTKDQAFAIWFRVKPICSDALPFRRHLACKYMHKNEILSIQTFNENQSILPLICMWLT